MLRSSLADTPALPSASSRRRFLRALGAGALTGTLSLAHIPSVRAAQGSQGNQSGAAINDAGEILFTDAVAKQLAASGAGWVHINFRLGGFPSWTETALGLYDQIITTAHANNLTVLGLLSNEAWQGIRDHWSANSAETGAGDGTNGYITDYVSGAVGVLVPRFAGRVDHWEIWNEPNLEGTYLYPSNFAQLLARSYREVRGRGLSARLLSGGIASQEDARGAITASSAGANYLTATYARGREVAGWNEIKQAYGSFPLDDIGQHIYIDGFKRTSGARIDKALSLLRNAYTREEGKRTPKKTHITEVGWSTTAVSEAVQADNLETAFGRFQATSYVQTAYWFFLQDEPARPDLPGGLHFGLLRPDGSEKPAWSAYQRVASY